MRWLPFITAPADILKKLQAIGTKTGAELSLDAVKAFRDDAVAAGLTLATKAIRRRLPDGAGFIGRHAGSPKRFSACNAMI